MVNKRKKEVDDLVLAWVTYGLSVFQGQERTVTLESNIIRTFESAFNAGRQVIEGLGGQKVGLVWGDDNSISIHQVDIPGDALIIKV